MSMQNMLGMLLLRSSVSWSHAFLRARHLLPSCLYSRLSLFVILVLNSWFIRFNNSHSGDIYCPVGYFSFEIQPPKALILLEYSLVFWLVSSIHICSLPHKVPLGKKTGNDASLQCQLYPEASFYNISWALLV